ncbi:MAG: glycosyl transferase [Nitratiruptor sp.]|nr:glycosyl transferase [Nitratiruptor sp.]NPA83176.1 glycosyltransferase [Campylobacterota bacterium]
MPSPTTSPLFSVIIPVYNREAFIARAIESVLVQTFRNFEIIVVDDGSQDASARIAASYPVRLLRNPTNLGVAAARNRGIQEARGSIIALLDSDDLWMPEKLWIDYTFFQRHPQFLIHQCEEVWLYKGKKRKKPPTHRKKGGWIFEDSCKRCLISPSAVAIKRELFHRVGLFDESFEVCEDYELWLRITRAYPVGLSPQIGVIKHGGHPDQLSRRHFGMDRWRVRALLRHLDHPAARQEALRKCEILLAGAYKHRNQEIIQEFEPIYRFLSSNRPEDRL